MNKRADALSLRDGFDDVLARLSAGTCDENHDPEYNPFSTKLKAVIPNAHWKFEGCSMDPTLYMVEPIGVVRSALSRLEDAPMQGDEGGPEAWLELAPSAAPGLIGIQAGDALIVLTWLHLAERDVLQVHPRGDRARPLTGVFATRSPDRPNPIGLHRVSVLEVGKGKLRVAPLEAIDGTPIIDLKPALASNPSHR